MNTGRTLTTIVAGTAAGLVLAGAAQAQGAKPLKKCPADAVVAGTVCLDKYEASVWRVPDAAGANKKLVKRIQQGKATLAALTAGGAMQLGTVGDDYAPCTANGQTGCADAIYAVSLPNVMPARYITWFQAQEACANSGKRLPSNAEWQVGANGAPDPGLDNGTTDCKTTGTSPVPTGSRSSCVSTRGAFDMVGNVEEWVADWVPFSTHCPLWGSFSNDMMCFAGASTIGLGPGVLVRGGGFLSQGSLAGPLAVSGNYWPSDSGHVGFRCAR